MTVICTGTEEQGKPCTLEYDIHRDAPGLPFVLRPACTSLKTRVVFTLIHPTRLGRLHDSVETDDLLHLESRPP
jgi:hypothetical protein